MANKGFHAAFGVAVGGGAAALVAKKNNEQALGFALQLAGGLVGGYHGGTLPDILEPAITPRHRGFGHSVTLAATAATAVAKKGADAISWARQRVGEIESQLHTETDPWRRLVLWALLVVAHFGLGYAVGLAAGYASHVGVDALTPGSLPLLVSGL